MIAYSTGVFDILRAKNLQDLNKKIQLSKEEGIECFGVGIYENELCENLGFNTPLKSLEDRMNIMKCIRGVDFVFPVKSLHEEILKDCVKKGYLEYKNEKITPQNESRKKYQLGYVPGTYDLFHAGHLENLMLASKDCEKLVVGVKSDELVQQHKNKTPIISENERMEILRNFKFVDDAYVYYTRDLKIAAELFKLKYGKKFDAVFYGSDLKKDFTDSGEFNIVFTPRDKETMKTRSSSVYRTLCLKSTTGNYTVSPNSPTSPLTLASRDNSQEQQYSGTSGSIEL